jgi:hypothetical protein
MEPWVLEASMLQLQLRGQRFTQGRGPLCATRDDKRDNTLFLGFESVLEF